MSQAPTITIGTTPEVLEYLRDLVASGLYGRSVEEAAERLVAQGLENKLRNRLLQLEPNPR